MNAFAVAEIARLLTRLVRRHRSPSSSLPIVAGGLGLWLGLQLSDSVQAATNTPKADPSSELFRDGVVTQLHLEVPAEGVRILSAYHQVFGKPRPPREDVKITVREGERRYTNVALHLKGSYSYQDWDGKPSLTLNFDKFAPGQTFHGLDKIHLNNSVQDPTYLSERISRELFQQAGVPSARVGHAVVHLDGRDVGLYVLVEGYNKRFIKRHFPSAQGNLYDGGSGNDITKALEADSGEDRTNRTDLVRLVAACREKGASNRLAALEKSLDVDRFLSFAAVEILLQHWDGYCLGPNNFRVFHDTSQDRMVFMPHGLDQILGIGLSPPQNLTPKWDGLVARGLLNLPEGRRRFLDRLEQVFTNSFIEEKLLTRVDTLAAQVRSSGGLGLIERFRYPSMIDGLKARISRRVEEVRSQLASREQPLVLEPEARMRLRGWKFRESANPPVTGQTQTEDGKRLLEVRAAGTWVAGSWRKSLFLDGGHYEFSGVARVEGLPVGATNSGIVLRISGERDATNIVTATTWTPLSYVFESPGPAEIELVCEYRGADGRGLFDTASLTLKKLSVPASGRKD